MGGGAGGGAGTGDGGAMMGTGPGAGDEPCPAEAIDTDCSGQCNAKAAACQVHGGSSCNYSILASDHLTDGKVFVRLPSHPGNQCTCTTGPATAFSTAIRFDYMPPAPFVHLSVPEPWFLISDGTYNCQFKQHASCLMINETTIWVVTNDPTAPAINLMFEPGSCP